MKEKAEDLFFLPKISYFVHRVCTPEWIIARQLIDFHDLTYVAAGQGEYIIDDVAHPVSQGDLIYIKPGTWREASTSAGQPMQLYAFNMGIQDSACNPAVLPLPLISKLGSDAKTDHLLERIKQFFALREQTTMMQATALLMELLCHIFLITGVVQGAGSDSRVKKEAAYVMENISRHISATEMGQAVGVHPGYLNKLTMKHTGKTVSRFITSIRVNMAEDAIVYEGISVSEAAQRFGFSDIYHFSKVFKKNKGYPPSTAKTLLR